MAGGGDAPVSVAYILCVHLRFLAWVVAVGTAGSLSASATDTAANSRLPGANQLLFSRRDTNLVLLRTTFGILFSHDGGNTWTWLCEDALGVSSTSTEDPSLALTANGSLVAGFSKGLSVSPDTGCNWTQSGALANQFVVDLTVRPDAPDVVLALTSTYAQGVADGGPGYAQQIYESDDDGTDWSARGTPLDPSMLVTTLEVSATDPNRIYVSAYRAGASPKASLFVSSDGAATWTERPVSLDIRGKEVSIYIAAVDPNSADRVYLRTSAQTTVLSRPGALPSRLLVSDDAGLTFRTALSLTGQMLGFALSSNGSTVFAGGVADGLFVGQASSLSFQKTSSIHVDCLATHGSDLWACSDNATGFIAGISGNDGTTFMAKAQLQAQPPLACAAGSTASLQCAGAPRDALCMALPGCDAEAGGAASGGGATAPPVTAQASKGCGCSLDSRDERAATLAAAGVFVAAAAAGRRVLRRRR